MLKSPEEIQNRKKLLRTIKTIYDKFIVNIIMEENLKVLLLTPGTRQRCTLSPLFFNIVLEGLASIVRHEMQIEVI